MDSTRFRTNFIDVNDSKLVEGSYQRAFAALSYVWGGATQVHLTTATKPVLFSDHGLDRIAASSALPRTIADAIALCKNIGISYLWVDALCIEQDSRDEMARQVRGMHHITSPHASPSSTPRRTPRRAPTRRCPALPPVRGACESCERRCSRAAPASSLQAARPSPTPSGLRHGSLPQHLWKPPFLLRGHRV